jgi:broad specificity phosphatase PhoE
MFATATVTVTLDDTRDLAIRIVEYLGGWDVDADANPFDPGEWDWDTQDAIQKILNEQFGLTDEDE